MSKQPFFIDYPQEKIHPDKNDYQCSICKISSLKINGLLENHDKNCSYRINQEKLHTQN